MRGRSTAPSPFESRVGINATNQQRRSWPRQARLLRRSEFQNVYTRGVRYNSPFFSAFMLSTGAPATRVGFTAPRALGKAVARNRIKRRMREAVRLHWPEIPAGWDVVFNPRRSVLDAEFTRLEREVLRLFDQAAARQGTK